MRRKITTLAVVGAATVSLAVGAAVWSASARTPSHTLKFTSVHTAQKGYGGHRFADADKDVKNGVTIGYDVVSGAFHQKTNSFTIDFAGSLAGGIIYGHGTGSLKTGAFSGKVTGGTGMYRGIGGTISGQATGKQGQNEKLVITYHH
jgi:hypothetical protein